MTNNRIDSEITALNNELTDNMDVVILSSGVSIGLGVLSLHTLNEAGSRILSGNIGKGLTGIGLSIVAGYLSIFALEHTLEKIFNYQVVRRRRDSLVRTLTKE